MLSLSQLRNSKYNQTHGADVLAGAAYYKGERKEGHAFSLQGIFSDRAGAYFDKYGKEFARQGMAKWYEQAILNARKNPKAQDSQSNSYCSGNDSS